MRTYSILFKAEFKRFWNVGIIVFAFAVIVIGLIPTVAMAKSGMITKLSKLIESSDQFISFFTFLIFSSGIVGSDIKSGWVRSLLVRSITRQQYVITKMSVVFAATVLVNVLSITLSLIILSFDPKVSLVVDPSITSWIVVLKCAQIFLMISLATFVSCGVQNAFNSIFVYGWMVLGQMFDFMIMRMFWDVKWAVVLKDYIFPSGFEEAQKAIIANMSFPYADVLWGCAALSFFFAVTLFSMNKVIVDIGSE